MQDEFEDFMDAQGREWFDGKAAGVTWKNADGSDRQAIARGLQTYDELQLEHEPDNAFDPNAIKVLTPAGDQVGYLEARLAVEIARRFRKGGKVKCFVRAVRESRGTAGVSFGLALVD